jgi:ubiquinone/menaquinone biosynthesis C-methylase UbiE
MRKLILKPGTPDLGDNDLNEPWPWESGSIDKILVSDLAETVADRMHFMREAWRVLRMGGEIDVTVLDAARSQGADDDPRHRSRWTEKTWGYFTAGAMATRKCSFRIMAGSTPAPDKDGRVFVRAVCTKVADAEQVVPESVSRVRDTAEPAPNGS